MPHGTPKGLKKRKREQEAPSWTPCTFERTYSLNGDPNTLAILRRTDGDMLADRRLKLFFCVISQDVYMVPDEFPPEYAKRYSPMLASGVYAVVNNTTTRCYVGTAKDIPKRVLEHNGQVSTRGAQYTLEGRPWRRVNLLTAAKDSKSKFSWSKSVLRKYAWKAWSQIPQSTLNEYVASAKGRFEECIGLMGARTNH